MQRRIKLAETIEEAMGILRSASSAEKRLRATIRNAATIECALEAMLATDTPEDEHEGNQFQTGGQEDIGAEYFKIDDSTDEENEAPVVQNKSAIQKESLNQNGEGQNSAKYFDIADDDDADEEVQEGPRKRPKQKGSEKCEVEEADAKEIKADPKPSGPHDDGEGSTSCLNTGLAHCGPLFNAEVQEG